MSTVVPMEERAAEPQIDSAEQLPETTAGETKEPSWHGNRHPIALRIQCLTLIAENYRTEEIERKLGIAKRTIYHIKKRARDRGFDPEKDPRILEKYVVDGQRTGRPRKSTAAVTAETDPGLENDDAEHQLETDPTLS